MFICKHNRANIYHKIDQLLILYCIEHISIILLNPSRIQIIRTLFDINFLSAVKVWLLSISGHVSHSQKSYAKTEKKTVENRLNESTGRTGNRLYWLYFIK